jgi:tripartite-type tricarboxylate transporter receptor subunit TctC
MRRNGVEVLGQSRFAPTVGETTMLDRRQFVHVVAAGAAVLPVARAAWAQAYPSRPVRIVVGFAAGNSPDILARLLGQWLTERLGQTFIVENRPGAGTNIATEAVLKSPPDGYTLLLSTPPNAINATLYDKLSFNFIRDSAPVAGISREPNVAVINPSLPVNTLAEFIAYAKARPRQLSYASAGVGGSSHVAVELFKTMTGIDMIHAPYRGGAPALTDVVSGQVQLYFPTTTTVIEHIRTGKVRALAVTTAARSSALPDVPSVSEFVPGYEASTFFGVVAPRNTPAEIVSRLNTEINAALADPTMKARITAAGGTVLPGPPEVFGQLIAHETEKWGKVVKQSGAKAD